ncbi:hypothetical protein F5Y14DRAFT_395319 [Nemania sp. NC0429]|nr:hypothetical protein F5Y14DRAFT_395319 [Nemania sp. NC0429]
MDNLDGQELQKQLAEARRQLREATRLAGSEKKRADSAEQRAESEKRRADREKNRANKQEGLLQRTTLDEYIEACHNLVYTKLNVEPDPTKTTTGSIPQPYGKYFPQRLLPWTDFLDEQTEMLSIVYEHFDQRKRLFDSLHYLETIGNKVLRTPIGNEKMLETFLHNCVEEPVRCIIYELSRSRRFQRKLKIGKGISFENHITALNDPVYAGRDRNPTQPPPPPMPQGLEQGEEPPRTPNPTEGPPRLNPDQICIYRHEEGGTESRFLIAVSEYKPPHKLSLQQLRAGLKETNMVKVVENNKIPNEEKAKFEHHATELVASAVTQTFHYMIRSGLAYGLLTTGEGIVFLKIDWNKPETAYYHLADPVEEVATHRKLRSCSAVSQYLGFHLLALSNYTYREQDIRDQAVHNLQTWSTDFRKAASTVPKKQRNPPQAVSYPPRNYGNVDRTVPSPKRRRLNPDDEHTNLVTGGVDDDDDDSDDDYKESGRSGPRNRPNPSGQQPSRKSARLAERHPENTESGDASQGARTRGCGGRDNDRKEYEGKPHQDLEYCTQKCVLGLVKGDVLDPDCPNIRLHQHRDNQSGIANTNSGHPISHSEFLQLLSRQLKCTLDYGITSLGVNGARGVLFKVTLLTYGYTFVSKGTVQAFIPYLEHEARVYERLKDVQGVHVPVFLGAIDLQPLGRRYFYDFHTDIVYLCLLSWGGLSLGDSQHPDRLALRTMAVEAMKAIHQQGVVHKDARYENTLFNPQTGRIMLIDFERSQFVDISRSTLSPLEPNKRRRVQDWKGRTKSVRDSSGNDLPPRNRDDFLADLAGLEAAF